MEPYDSGDTGKTMSPEAFGIMNFIDSSLIIETMPLTTSEERVGKIGKQRILLAICFAFGKFEGLDEGRFLYIGKSLISG
jgi:hypothetical protein